MIINSNKICLLNGPNATWKFCEFLSFLCICEISFQSRALQFGIIEDHIVLSVCSFSISPIGFTDQTGEGAMKISSIPCYGPIKYTCWTDETKLSCGRLVI